MVFYFIKHYFNLYTIIIEKVLIFFSISFFSNLTILFFNTLVKESIILFEALVLSPTVTSLIIPSLSRENTISTLPSSRFLIEIFG